MSKIHNRIRAFFHILLLLTVTAAGTLWYFTPIPAIWCWVTAVTGTTVVAFWYDKGLAGKNRVRIPESQLHLLAMAGGSLGAFFAAYVFRHKISKRPFMVKLIIIFLVQIILGITYVVMGMPALNEIFLKR